LPLIRAFTPLCRASLGALVLLTALVRAGEPLRGTVVDPADCPVAGAHVRVLSATGQAVAETNTDAEGAFSVSLPARGTFSVSAASGGLSSVEQPLDSASTIPLVLPLRLFPLRTEITVTASRGFVEQPGASAAIVDVRDIAEIRSRPLPTIGHALEGGLGILLQQTSAAQASPFLRGLTGYQVLNLIDGVRFNNSTFRSGPNQYLAFVEPSQVQRIETALGPSSSQYGSDSLGGTIQVITPEARLERLPRAVHGAWNLFGATADASGGADARISLGSDRLALIAGASAMRHNDLRAGAGQDSRHVLRRFFGMSGAEAAGLTGNRQQDTAFTQWAADAKLAARAGAGQTLTLWVQQSSQAGSRNYKDLWGGLGRLESALDPQELRFGYVRYEKSSGLGRLDNLVATFSVNSQSDGARRQNLRLTDSITVDDSLVNAFGYSVQAASHLGRRHAIVFGGEWYDERISSARTVFNPVTAARQGARPLYPNGSRYHTGGVFLQDRFELGRRLQATLGGRWTRAGFTNPSDAFGRRASAQDFGDWTFNTALAWQLHPALSVVGLVGRGFRAPNANDLGAIGVNDLGYEIPAADATPAGALLASSAAEGATSLGRAVEKLRAEQLLSYEAGLRLRTRKIEARLQFFDTELYDPIVRRTLLFPRDRAPATLAGLPVAVIPPTAAQQAQGVVAVATSYDPRAVKAFVNDGRARYYGAEASGRLRFTSHWAAEAGFSYIVGRDLDPNRHIRRLPPAHGMAALEHTRTRFWWRAYLLFAGPQNRLSGGDLDDERIGASRSRSDIAAVFESARLSPFIRQGVFVPTGETLRQIQDRVLPGVADSTRVALYQKTAGWLTCNLHGGYSLTERVSVTGGVFNMLDRNYRVHGSGLDAPGVSAFLGLRFRY
jgi:hemoglobin/transferrin/lactoferrin receptor protein